MKVTVITPTWNQAEFIEKTIQSVVEQDYQDIEYIILDSCSDDGTQEIVEKYCKDYSFIKYIREKDHGQAEAINKGLERATGDIVCWLNSDDFYYDSKVISTVVDEFEKNPEIEVLLGDGYYCDKEANITEYIDSNRNVPNWVLTRWYYVLQPAIFWKKNEERLDEHFHYVFDWKFFAGMLNHGKVFHFVKIPFAVYRMYETNKTGLANAPRKKEIYEMQKEFQVSKFNIWWCKRTYKAYEYAERKNVSWPKKIVDFGSKFWFHLTGKRVCSF